MKKNVPRSKVPCDIAKALKALSKMALDAKWKKNNTPELRKACTAKATEARRKQAKLRKVKLTP
jgi:predicted transcriptional regulator